MRVKFYLCVVGRLTGDVDGTIGGADPATFDHFDDVKIHETIGANSYSGL